jgi:hypothetical protein
VFEELQSPSAPDSPCRIHGRGRKTKQNVKDRRVSTGGRTRRWYYNRGNEVKSIGFLIVGRETTIFLALKDRGSSRAGVKTEKYGPQRLKPN